MNNKEIKEMLQTLQRRDERYNYCRSNDILFSDIDYQAHLILDYITNLQQEKDKHFEHGLILAQELENLHQRIDKALNYIDENILKTKDQYMLNDLYEILYGDNND